jgi:DNA polymerase-3 subunit delta
MTNVNVVLLYGNDEFAMRRRAAELSAIFDDPSSADMNTSMLDGASMSDNDLNNAVNAAPFLAEHRLVLLANPSARYAAPKSTDKAADKAQAKAQAERRAEARKKFLEFISKISPATKLVITENVEMRSAAEREAAERHWLVKWFKKEKLGLERFALPLPKDMAGWISRHVRDQKAHIEPAAAQKLAELTGADTRQAAQEVEKLLTYVNWSRPITLEDVEAVSSFTAEPDIFAMVDALATGDGKKAQGQLRRLLEHQDAFMTWGMVIRQFRLVLLAREVIDGGGGEGEVVRVLGVHPFVAEKVFKQAKGFTLPELEKIYHKLLEIDEAAKTGRMPLDLGMDLLVAELAA